MDRQGSSLAIERHDRGQRADAGSRGEALAAIEQHLELGRVLVEKTGDGLEGLCRVDGNDSESRRLDLVAQLDDDALLLAARQAPDRWPNSSRVPSASSRAQRRPRGFSESRFSKVIACREDEARKARSALSAASSASIARACERVLSASSVRAACRASLRAATIDARATTSMARTSATTAAAAARPPPMPASRTRWRDHHAMSDEETIWKGMVIRNGRQSSRRGSQIVQPARSPIPRRTPAGRPPTQYGTPAERLVTRPIHHECAERLLLMTIVD